MESLLGGPDRPHERTVRLPFFPSASGGHASAIRDGVKDARAGRPAYFWSLLTEDGHRGERLHEGWGQSRA